MKAIQIPPAMYMLTLLGLGGCAVGPDFHRPAAPPSSAYQPASSASESNGLASNEADAQRLDSSADIPAQWWTLFHSQHLNDLIERSLQANPDVAAAQAALRVARENVYAQQGAYYPSLDANFNPTRQKTAGSLSAIPSSGAYIYNLHTAQLTVSYVPDVFGGNRRAVESLQAQEEAQRFQLEAARLTLTSNLANDVVQAASLRAQIVATQAIIDDQRKTLDSFQKQFDLGQLAQADVAAQQAALAQTQASLPPLQKQFEQQRDAIKALAGQYQDADLDPALDLESIQLPNELPLSLPVKLIEQRPDVRAAEAQWHSASAQIGVAVANRLPNLSIDGSFGSTADKISNLFGAGTAFWSLAGNVTQPIFQGGTLLHRQRAAEAAYDQASAQYRSTVLTALQSVADVLHAIDADRDGYHAALDAEHAAARSLQISHRLLQLGSINYLAMLSAEQTWRQAKINLIVAQTNRLADSVALLQALGGGWWNGDGEQTAAVKLRSIR